MNSLSRTKSKKVAQEDPEKGTDHPHTRLRETMDHLRLVQADEQTSAVLTACTRLVDAISDGAALLDESGMVLYVNRSLASLLDLAENHRNGFPFTDLLASDPAAWRSSFTSQSQGGTIGLLLRGKRESIPAAASLQTIHADGARLVAVLIRDVQIRRHRERSLRFVHDLAIAVSHASEPNSALQVLLESVAELTGWPYGEAWLPTSTRLELASASFARDPGLLALRQQYEDASLPQGAGLAGRCWAAREPVWIKNTAGDPGFAGIAGLAESGLSSAVAIPVMTMERVTAVLVFGLSALSPKDEEHIRMVANACLDIAPLIEKKLTDEELSRQRAWLSEAQRLAHLGSWEWSIHENQVTASPEMERILGTAPGTLNGPLEALLLWMHADDRLAAEAVLRKALLDRKSFQRLFRMLGPDGAMRWVEANGQVVLGHDGNPERIIVACLDITARKLTEEELRARETRIALMLRQMPAMLWTTDTSLRYTSVQGTVLIQPGTRPEELVGRPLFGKSGDLDEATRSSYEAHHAALDGRPATYEIERDGRTYEARVEGLRSLDGRITGCIGVAVDISDRKSAERLVVASRDELERQVRERTADLDRARQRVQSILDSITDNYYVLDNEWRFLEVNYRALEYFGKKREELIGRSIWDIFPQGRDSRFGKAFDQAREKNTPVHVEGRSVLVDRWTSWHVYPTAEGFTVYFTDITERHEAEEALRASEERFRAMLENARDVVYRMNLQSQQYEYISPSSSIILGFSPDELKRMGVGATIERVHPDDRKLFVDGVLTQRELGMDQPFATVEYRWLHRNGHYRWISALRSLVRDSGGQPIASVCSLRDITDRRRFIDDLTRANHELQREIERRREIQRALQTSELRYRAIVEDQTDLVARFKDDGTLTFANEAYCRFFGKSRDELIGHVFTPVVDRDDQMHMRGLLATLSPMTPAVSIENRVLRADGEMRWIQWTNHALLDESGKVVEYQSAGRDMTERKNAELLLSVQYEVTLTLAEASTVNEAMRRALQAICQRLDWDLAILWRVERGSNALRFEGIWHVPGVESVMVEHSLLPEMDVPGKVLRERRSLWVPDVRQEQGAQVHAGFQSIFAFPARAGGNITAVIECFSRSPRPFRLEVRETLEAIGFQIGNYRERKAAEESLRRAAEDLEIKVQQRTEQLAGALDALSNSEMRFRTMFEGAPLGIALVSTAGLITERNPMLERMLGYKDGELYNVRFESLVHPDDREIAAVNFSNLVEGRRPLYRVELRFLRSDGGIVWGSVSSAAMSFEGNEASFATVMIKDITERKEMEQELRESENRFRTVFEEAPIGIALLNADGVYVQTNNAMHEMLGYEPGELIGKTLRDVVHPGDLQEDVAKLADMAAGRLNRYQMEKRYIRKDGLQAWGNLNATTIRSVTGDFLYSLRLVEDITARKQAEEQIHMLAHTITSMNESVMIVNTEYHIISVNSAFMRTFGYEEEEVLGRHLESLSASDTTGQPALTEIFRGTSERGWTGELSVARKDGHEFPILLSTSVVRNEQGSPIALVGIARDITEQRRLQQQLEEAERRRSEDLRRFAISVQRAQEEERQRISRELHDDICQRLSGMKLNMEVLEDDVRTTDKKVYRTLRGFRKQFEQTIVEVRRLSSNLRPTVLDDFGLAIAINLLTREFEKAHKIKVKVETGDPSLRHLDPEVEIALYRIAQESLANIAKHAHATQVKITLHQHDRSVELMVQDNGKGFDERETLHARKEGHGMGLISMRERAELLGGTCTIESAKSRGTTIHVMIPLEVRANHEKN